MSESKKLNRLTINKETISDLEMNKPDDVKGGGRNDCQSQNPVSCDACKDSLTCNHTKDVYCGKIKAR